MVPAARQAGSERSRLSSTIAAEHRHVNGALLLYHRPAFITDAATITDHMEAFGRFSRFPFWSLNTDAGFPSGLAGVSFDAVVIHYTVFASGPSDYWLGAGFLDWLDGSDDAYKVAFFQDEHLYCQRRFGFLNEHGIDCVYTCVEPEYFNATYGKYTEVPKLVSHVPAYVAPDMVKAAKRLRTPDAERPLDIGYRARPTPPYFGRGGMEKYEIGERFAAAAKDSGLKLDLSAREEDRLYGQNWYRFMASCRGFLGTESGVSCVDLEDEVRLEYEARVAAGENPTIEDLESGALGRWDWKVPLRTTSSRHFEAAALGVCQIMYEGRYSGALEAGRHYLALRKDFSNFDDVLARFRDPEARRRITEAAYEDLIASGAHSYERFIEEFDEVLIEAGLTPPADSGPSRLIGVSLRGRPPQAVARRYIAGAANWMARNHPTAWKAMAPFVHAAYYVVKGTMEMGRRIRARLGGGAG